MRLRPGIAASLLVILLPVAILHPALFGDRVFVPFDHRVFPPESTALSDAELQQLRESGNFDITDKTVHNLPQIRLARQELQRGRLPVWDSYARVGTPLFATSPSALAHPLFLQHLLMDPERAFAITTWLLMALAGLFMLGLLRELGAGWPAAAFGAVVFAWSGTLTARLHLFQHCAVLLWLPAMLWAVTRLHRGGGPRAMLALAIATAMTWTAGHPPGATATSLTAGVWFLCGCPRAGRRALALGSCGFGLGLLLAAGVIAPLAAYVVESGRATDAALTATRRAWELDPAAWLGFLLESPFSTPSSNREGGIPHHTAPLLWLLHSRAGAAGVEPLLSTTEHRVYFGALPLLLVPFGIGKGKLKSGGYAVLAAAVLLVLATGRAPFDWLTTAVPPIGFLKPMELFPPVACLVAVAAALGFDRVLAAPRSVAALWLVGAATAVALACVAGVVWLSGLRDPMASFLGAMEVRWGAVFHAAGRDEVRALFAPALEPALELLTRNLWRGAVVFGLAGVSVLALRRSVPAGAAVAIALTVAELVTCAVPHNRCHAPTPPGATPVHEFLRRERDRLADRGGFAVARVAAAPADTGSDRDDAIAVPELPIALPPGVLQPERIRDLNAYALLDGRSHLPFGRLYRDSPVPITLRARWLRAFPDDARITRPLLDLYGVRYLLSWAPSGRRPSQHAGELAVAPVVGTRGTFYVHERPEPCPRAFVVPRAETLDDEDAVLEAMVAPEFAPRDSVLLTRSAVRAAGVTEARLDDSGGSGGGDVRFELDEATHVVLNVRDCGGGFLVMADAAMSGWSARVDGEPAPILRGDFCFRAVPVPPGDVRVELRYRAPLLLQGAVISAAALLACAIVLLTSFRRGSTR